MISEDVRLKRSGGVSVRWEAGRMLVVEDDAAVVHELNSTAAAIWEACDGTTRVSELVEAITELTGRPREETQNEVGDLVTDLVRRGLLVSVP